MLQVTQVTARLFNLTLPPLPINPKFHQFILVTVVIGVGLAVAWLPLTWVFLLLGGAIFLTLLLIKPILSLYLLIPIIPFSSLLAVPLGNFNAGLMEMVLALGIVAWLVQILARQSPKSQTMNPAPPLLWPFFLFLGGVGLSWLNALSIGASLIETTKWVEMLALYLFVVALLPARHIKWVVSVILLTGLAQAALGLYQFIFKVGPEGFLLFDGRFLRAYGTFAQPNPYAGYLGLVLPLALSLTIWAFRDLRYGIWDIRSNRSHISHLTSHIFFALSFGLLLAALFATQSRGAWVGFALAAVVTLGVRSKKAAMILITLALIGALIGLAGSFDWGIANTSVITQRLVDAVSIASISDISAIEVNDANFATIERLAHWQAAREMWRDHLWLGAGFGNYAVVYPVYAVGRWLDPLGHAHNYLLNIGAEAGLIGITAYLIFWILTFRVSWLALQRSQGFNRAVVAGGLGILVHLHIHNLFDNLYVQGMYLHVAIVLALISLICQCHPTKPSKERTYQ
ncbi:MAG TPA: O-antigen ligase family protein [Anaerolineae bacterium]|nr:O-antigen ligase family protein [Anaerolineae bacterium]